MGNRSFNDPYGDAARISDKMLGTVYDDIRFVGSNIEYIKHLSFHMANLWEISLHMDEMFQVYNDFEDIRDFYEEIFPNMPKISNISDSITELLNLENNLPAVLSVNDNLTTINSVSTNIAAVQAVNTNMATLQTVEDNLALFHELVDNYPNMVQNVADAKAQADRAELKANAAEASATAVANSLVAIGASVTAAANSATAAANSVTAATSQGDRAETQAIRAETAAANSVASANIFSTTALGLAGTSNGQQFAVLSSDGLQIVRYRNNSGSAVEVGRFATPAYVATFENGKVEKNKATASRGVVYTDYYGVLGTNNALYLPRTLFAGDYKGTIHITTNLTTSLIGTDSTEMPGWQKLVLPSTTDLQIIYLNVTDLASGYQVAAYNNWTAIGGAGDRNIVLVGIAWGLWFRPFDGFAVDFLEDRQGAVYMREPIIIEKDKVLVPYRIYTANVDVPGMSEWGRDPYTLPLYAEISTAKGNGNWPTTNIQLLVKNPMNIAANGHPWELKNYSTRPGKGFVVPLVNLSIDGAPNGYSSGTGEINASPMNGGRFLGDLHGLNAKNRLRYNSKNDLSSALIYAEGTVVDITHEGLLAMGFTKGVVNAVSGRAYYGDFINFKKGDYVHYRVIVISTSAPAYTKARGFLLDKYGTPSGTPAFTRYLYYERELFPGVYVFSGTTRVVDDARDAAWVGYDGTTTDVILGVQIAVSNKQEDWILTNDYEPYVSSSDGSSGDLVFTPPPDISLLYPNEMFLIEDRPQRLYPNSILEQITESAEILTTLAVTGNGPDRFPAVVQGRGDMLLKDIPSGSGEILSRSLATTSTLRKRKAVQVRTAAANALNGKNITGLFIGDSLTDWTGAAVAPYHKALALGANLTLLGTMNQTERPTGRTCKGEGRSGREFADYINKHTDAMAPIPVGGEATYLARSDTAKRSWNPFIRAATGSDPVEKVFNGYIFDFAFYLNRFGYTAPDFVVINLATNDLSQQGASVGTENSVEAFNIIRESIRASGAEIEIALALNARGFASNFPDRWMPHEVTLIRAMINLVYTLNDDYLALLPAYAHQSREAGWEQSVTTVDLITDVETVNMTDSFHFRGVGKEQYAEMVVAWLAHRFGQ